MGDRDPAGHHCLAADLRKQLSQLVDALIPPCLHAGQHLWGDRNETDGVSLQCQHRFPLVLAENDGCLAFEQMLAILVDGDVREHKPLRWNNFAKLALHWIFVAVRSVHHDAQAAADAHVELADGTGEATRPEPLPHYLRVGPGFPHQGARRIEDAGQRDTSLSE